MATELNKKQWIEIITNEKLTNDTDLSIFQALYSFDSHKAYASQIGILLGYKGKAPQAPLNSEIGRYAKRISQFYDIEFTERNQRKYKYWDLFFNGWEEGKYFVWQLKPEIADALKESRLTGELQYAEEILTEEKELFAEGAKKVIIINSYERNPKARMLCIEHWGCSCSVCGLDFQAMYGDIGVGFIHVHHLVPISQIDKLYQVDPVEDLRPVCPNCHSMIHTSNPPLTILQLKEIVDKNK
ncbi:MAG: HNH endonuclease [Desulfococcaceae bacterium]|jgi:5-methylcytosine-specific restriction protein A|nr:HNH endonuclease [Desulfococcaceae bacterium]